MSRVCPAEPPAGGRSPPRWSSDGPASFDPPSIAGDPSRSACVRVGPPLSASGPSFGSVLVLSLGSRRLQPRAPVWSFSRLSRLLPWETNRLPSWNEAQLLCSPTAVPPATIVLRRLTIPEVAMLPPLVKPSFRL